MGYDVEYLERLYWLFATGKAKVDTELTLNVDKITVGNLKVGSTDQITANKFLLTDNQGRLLIVVDDSIIGRAQHVVQESDLATISAGNTQDLLDLTVPAGKIWYISSFSGGGEGDGEVFLEIDGVNKSTRTFVQQNSIQHILKTPVKVAAGKTVKIKITNGAPSSAQFTADINGFSEDV